MAREQILVLNINQLKTPGVFETFLEQVSPDRRQRVERHATVSGKLQSLGAGLVLNEILEQFGLNSSETVLEYGENQKPYIPHCSQLHFNLTHSGDYAAGGPPPTPVGIDIEQVGSDGEEVARRFFHESELRWLEGLSSEAERIQGFFRMWVLKESFLKATGLGMRLPLNAFEIRIEDEDISVKQKVNENTYYFKEFELEGCRGAVCAEEPEVRGWRLEKILL